MLILKYILGTFTYKVINLDDLEKLYSYSAVTDWDEGLGENRLDSCPNEWNLQSDSFTEHCPISNIIY